MIYNGEYDAPKNNDWHINESRQSQTLNKRSIFNIRCLNTPSSIKFIHSAGKTQTKEDTFICIICLSPGGAEDPSRPSNTHTTVSRRHEANSGESFDAEPFIFLFTLASC